MRVDAGNQRVHVSSSASRQQWRGSRGWLHAPGGRNASNPRIGSGMQQARELLAGETGEVVQNGEVGCARRAWRPFSEAVATPRAARLSGMTSMKGHWLREHGFGHASRGRRIPREAIGASRSGPMEREGSDAPRSGEERSPRGPAFRGDRKVVREAVFWREDSKVQPGDRQGRTRCGEGANDPLPPDVPGQPRLAHSTATHRGP
jgi:hypothetical protein